MCNDYLPEEVNAFLDDVETGMCLPILMFIVLCTLQFILNHTLDIGCTLASLLKSSSSSSSVTLKSETSAAIEPMMKDIDKLPEKLKGMLSNLGTRIAAGFPWGRQTRPKDE